MNSNIIHRDISNSNPIKNKNNISKELSHIKRMNFNTKNIKLNIIPHSLSQNKNNKYNHPSSLIPRIIHSEKYKITIFMKKKIHKNLKLIII